MEQMMENIAESLVGILSAMMAARLLIAAIGLLLTWLFLRSAITSGVKRGILMAHDELERLKKNPPPSPEEQLEEELKGWE